MTNQTRIEAQLDYLSDMAQSTSIHHEDGTEFTVKDLQKIIVDSLTAIEERQKEADLRDYAKRLSGVIEDLGFMQNAFDLVPNPKTLDEDEIALYFNSTFKLLVSSMDKLTGIMDELDEISYALLNN